MVCVAICEHKETNVATISLPNTGSDVQSTHNNRLWHKIILDRQILYEGFTTPCNSNSEACHIYYKWNSGCVECCSVCTSITKSKVVGPHIQTVAWEVENLYTVLIYMVRSMSTI